jgi:hypothetical protein
VLHRIHRRDKGPWWFSHDGSGRFDLCSPTNGTCYLALDDLGAFIEVFRRPKIISPKEIADRLHLEAILAGRPPLQLANTTTRAAHPFGVTAAIGASQEYPKTQEWAEAFWGHGFDGVLYRVSHDPEQTLLGVALFGLAGDQSDRYPGGSHPLTDELLYRAQNEFHYEIVGV